MRCQVQCQAILENTGAIPSTNLETGIFQILVYLPIQIGNRDERCNNPSPLLTDIVNFSSLRIVVSNRERFLHPYKECFVPFFN